MAARVIVIGGGIVGVATARELVLRGHDVTLVETGWCRDGGKPRLHQHPYEQP